MIANNSLEARFKAIEFAAPTAPVTPVSVPVVDQEPPESSVEPSISTDESLTTSRLSFEGTVNRQSHTDFGTAAITELQQFCADHADALPTAITRVADSFVITAGKGNTIKVSGATLVDVVTKGSLDTHSPLLDALRVYESALDSQLKPSVARQIYGRFCDALANQQPSGEALKAAFSSIASASLVEGYINNPSGLAHDQALLRKQPDATLSQLLEKVTAAVQTAQTTADYSAAHDALGAFFQAFEERQPAAWQSRQHSLSADLALQDRASIGNSRYGTGSLAAAASASPRSQVETAPSTDESLVLDEEATVLRLDSGDEDELDELDDEDGTSPHSDVESSMTSLIVDEEETVLQLDEEETVLRFDSDNASEPSLVGPVRTTYGLNLDEDESLDRPDDDESLLVHRSPSLSESQAMDDDDSLLVHRSPSLSESQAMDDDDSLLVHRSPSLSESQDDDTPPPTLERSGGRVKAIDDGLPSDTDAKATFNLASSMALKDLHQLPEGGITTYTRTISAGVAVGIFGMLDNVHHKAKGLSTGGPVAALSGTMTLKAQVTKLARTPDGKQPVKLQMTSWKAAELATHVDTPMKKTTPNVREGGLLVRRTVEFPDEASAARFLGALATPNARPDISMAKDVDTDKRIWSLATKRSKTTNKWRFTSAAEKSTVSQSSNRVTRAWRSTIPGFSNHTVTTSVMRAKNLDGETVLMGRFSLETATGAYLAPPKVMRSVLASASVDYGHFQTTLDLEMERIGKKAWTPVLRVRLNGDKVKLASTEDLKRLAIKEGVRFAELARTAHKILGRQDLFIKFGDVDVSIAQNAILQALLQMRRVMNAPANQASNETESHDMRRVDVSASGTLHLPIPVASVSVGGSAGLTWGGMVTLKMPLTQQDPQVADSPYVFDLNHVQIGCTSTLEVRADVSAGAAVLGSAHGWAGASGSVGVGGSVSYESFAPKQNG